MHPRPALLLGLCSLLAAPGLASVIEVGASGQCYQAAGTGSEDEARVRIDTTDPARPRVVLPTGTGALGALLQFAGSFLGTSRGCPDAPGQPSADDIEADARLDGTVVQACYGEGVLLPSGGCPTSPGAPGP